MKFSDKIKPGALLFAPMEGITDPTYRQCVGELYPKWDYFFTDFLRIPTVGIMPAKKILEHYGQSIYSDPTLKSKTALQILTTIKAQTVQHLELIEELEIEHIDLNLGCPSRKVNSHGGGAYLLSDLVELETILKTIRQNFKGLFTIKIRIGYRNDELFDDIIRLANDQGVAAITIHGRTRDLLYKGVANWNYIERAVSLSSVPIIGNGDIWGHQDIANIFEQTGCYAVMAARGAMKTPWLADRFPETPLSRQRELIRYFNHLEQAYRRNGVENDHILRRFKALSRYLFDPFENPEMLKRSFMRTHDLALFLERLHLIEC